MALGNESRDLTFEAGITEGVSKQGMEDYLEKLKAELLVGVANVMDETEDMVNVINQGWQGVSRDKFFEQFDKAISATKADLYYEYCDLVNKLSELAQNYYSQDANMIVD